MRTGTDVVATVAAGTVALLLAAAITLATPGMAGRLRRIVYGSAATVVLLTVAAVTTWARAIRDAADVGDTHDTWTH